MLYSYDFRLPPNHSFEQAGRTGNLKYWNQRKHRYILLTMGG
jgi:hypothetical protein